MNDIKKIIIVLIIIIILIIGILVILKKSNKASDINRTEYVPDVIITDSLEKVTVRNDYFTIKNIVEQYYSRLCDLNKTTNDILVYEYDEEVGDLDKELEAEKARNKRSLISFFDEGYIIETSLSTDNIQEKLGNYNDLYVLIENMYIKDITVNLKAYFIFGTLTEKTKDFKLMVVTDSYNGTFNIYTSEYIDKYKLYELSKDELKNQLFNTAEIKNRIYNKYSYKVVQDEEYAKELLKSYTETIRYNIKYSYNNLAEEYKTSKFENIAEYEKYIEENKISIIATTLKYYQYNIFDGYIQYVCIDQNGRYYIFNQTSIMNYSLYLDNYTIDLPEFTSKYETATTYEKVALNIQKIVEALNAKDYKYVYSKLADEFKSNYFKTYEDFEEYAKTTFDVENEVTFMNYTESDELSTYQITLKGKSKTITKTIVMRLDEGTNFVMSFNVN